MNKNLHLDAGKARSQLKLLDEAARLTLAQGFGHHRPSDLVLKEFFRSHHQCGSRDRAFISEALYALLRYWGMIRLFLPESRRREAEQGNIRLTPVELGALLLAGCHIGGCRESAVKLREILDLPELPHPAAEPAARARQMAGYFHCEAEIRVTDLVPEELQELFPADLDRERFFSRLLERPPMWLRLQSGAREAVLAELREQGAEAVEHPLVKSAVAVRAGINLRTLATFRQGAFEIQDLASQCVGLAAAPAAGERWYDPCAGAGGKTLQLASLMRGRGSVTAGDVRAYKLEDLRLRARRAGFSNIITRPHDGGEWRGKHPYDGVLVDAPCSCSGVWRRNPGSQWQLTPAEVTELAALQARILHAHREAVKINGVLIYATCSLFDAENSAVAEAFLAEHPGFRLEPFEHPLTGAMMPGMARINSYDDDCDTLFVARFRRIS